MSVLGDIIDTQDYSVIAASLEHDFLMAYKAIDQGEEGHDQIVITNRDETFTTCVLSTDPEQDLKESGQWINYFICGYKAILSHDEKLKAMVS